MFNSSNLKEIRVDINAALESVAKKYGMSLKLGNISYDPTSFTAQLKAYAVENGEDPTDPLAADRAKFVNDVKHSFELSEDDFDKEITYGGNTYRLRGYKPKARKYPLVLLKVENGKRYKFPMDVLEFANEK